MNKGGDVVRSWLASFIRKFRGSSVGFAEERRRLSIICSGSWCWHIWVEGFGWSSGTARFLMEPIVMDLHQSGIENKPNHVLIREVNVSVRTMAPCPVRDKDRLSGPSAGTVLVVWVGLNTSSLLKVQLTYHLSVQMRLRYNKRDWWGEINTVAIHNTSNRSLFLPSQQPKRFAVIITWLTNVVSIPFIYNLY